MYKNHEGYPDPAAGAAIREADRPPEDYHRTVRMMLFIAKCMGYHVEDTIRLRDERQGGYGHECNQDSDDHTVGHNRDSQSDLAQHRPLGLPDGLGFPDGGADGLEVMLCRGQYIMTCMIAGSLWGGTVALSCKRDSAGSVGLRSISTATWESCTRSGT